MYSEIEFKAMINVYGDDHSANGKPWKLFDEFYKCHAHWRSKARVNAKRTDEEILADILKDESKFEAMDHANGTSESGGRNQITDESSGRIHG